MAFQPVPDTASITFSLSGSGVLADSEAQFTFYVRDTVGAPPWDITAVEKLADFGEAWWQAGKNAGAPFRDHFVDDWTLDAIVVRNLETAGGIVFTEPVGTAGTNLDPPPPPSVALLVQFQGDGGGEPTRGWVFIPSGNETVLDGNLYSALHRDAVRQGVVDFQVDLNDPAAGGDLNWAMVIVSRSEGTAAQLAAVASARAQLKAAIAATRRATAVTNTLASITARRLIASQRDRRAGA